MIIYDMPEREKYGYSSSKVKEFFFNYKGNVIGIYVSIGSENGSSDNPDPLPLAMINVSGENGLDFLVVIKNSVLIDEIVGCIKNLKEELKEEIFNIALSFLKGEYVIQMLKETHNDGIEKGKKELKRQLYLLIHE